MRISDWSSDVCSSDLGAPGGFVRSFLDERQPLIGLLKSLHASLSQLPRQATPDPVQLHLDRLLAEAGESGPTALPNVDPDLAELIASLSETERRLQIGRASCRERVCQYV